MQVTWVIENFVKEPSYLELANSVKKLGHNLLELNDGYAKSSLDALNWQSPTAAMGSNDKCVIFNGSIEMAKLIRKDLKSHCQPVVYSNFDKYLCQTYYPRFAEYLFNDKCVWTTLEQFKRKKLFYYGILGADSMIFIRPDSGEKEFQAQLLDIIDADRFCDENEHLKNSLVLLSTPKNIKWEGRIIVSRRKEIIAHSTYRFQGKVAKIPAIPDGAKKLAEELLSKVEYYPDSVFCYDLCEDSDGKYWLLELTSFSSAGLYASDKDKIVEKVSELALEDMSAI